MKLAQQVALAGILLMGLPAFAQDQSIADKSQFVAQAKAPSACMNISPLTDDQRQKLSSLKDKFELDTADKRAQLKVAQRQLRRDLTSVSVDKSAALSLQSKINGLRDDLSNARLNLMLASGDVFTAEQREAFQKMHRFGHHRMHRGFGGGERREGHDGRGPVSNEGRQPNKVG